MEINHDTDDFLTELWSLRERYMDLRNRLVNITPILYINSVDVYGDLYHRDLSKLREDEDRDVKKVLNKYKNSGERSLVPKVGDISNIYTNIENKNGNTKHSFYISPKLNSPFFTTNCQPKTVAFSIASAPSIGSNAQTKHEKSITTSCVNIVKFLVWLGFIY